MSTVLKMEMKRAFSGKAFWGTMLLGIGIACWQLVLVVIPNISMLDNYKLGKGEYPVSVFNSWLGGEGYSAAHSI